MNRIAQEKLGIPTKLGFGVCDVGGNLFFTVIAFQMASYLTDCVGLAAGLMGIAMLIGRIVDAVTDPLMGYLSDRTRTRWGRRRPYLLFGSFPLFLLMGIMFSIPDLNSQAALFISVTLLFCLLSVSYTVVNIPYGALTPELTKDFHERTSLNGYRMSFAVIGTLIGAGAALPIVNALATERAGYSVMGFVFGAIMLVTALITFFTVREPDLATASRVESDCPHPVKEYRAALGNRPFLLILLPWACFITGVTIISSMLKYLFEYVYLDPAGVTPALLTLLLSALLAIPIWVVISRRIGKKSSYMIGMSILSLFCLILAFTAGSVRGPLLYGLMAFGGFGLSTQYVIPYALIPDAVEWDYCRSGKRREGIYYGLWTFISKLGQGFSGLIIGLTLSSRGYIANTVQSEAAVWGIRLLTGPIPVVFFVIGIMVLRFYPITEKIYERMVGSASS